MKNLTSHSMKYLVLFFAFLLSIANSHAQSVTVVQSPSGTICSGTSVEFTANPSGFSGQIYYQWYLNGTAIPGANGVKYTTSTLNNGDQIYVQCSNSTVSEMVAGSEFYYDATNPISYRGGSATIKDLSGKGRDGTMQGFISQGNTNASWNATNGGVFNFNGTNQYITTGWTPSNTMSFQLAFRSLEAFSASWNRGLISTFGLSNPVNPTTDFMGFYIGTRPVSPTSGNNLHYYYDYNETGNIGTTNSTFNSTTQWYVLTVVSNPADNAGNGSIKFYLNGNSTPLASTTSTYGADKLQVKTTHAGNIVVGRSRYDTDYWLGYIANVIVYNRVLSTQEIAANYNATIGRVTGASSASVISTVTNSIVLSSSIGTNSQSICNNTAITNITYTTTGATNATFTGLPNGVSGTWNNNVVTISGTPTQAGTFNYTVSLVGGCNPTTAQGTIVVNLSNNTISLTSAAGTNSQSSCRNSTITNITYATTGATNATVTGLPNGVSGSWNNNVVTISGTPVPTSGTFNYTVTLTGGCGTITANGSITINTNAVPSVPFTLTGDGCSNNRTALSSTNSFNSYAWFLNGSEISNTNTKTYSPTAAGNYYVRVFNGTCYGTSSDITINVCGITQTGQMSPTTYMINTLGGAANTANKGVDERGLILKVPN
jgi:Concanavalin A-like lectin/glucanases superfamily